MTSTPSPAPATDSATKAQSAMKQFAKTDEEIDQAAPADNASGGNRDAGGKGAEPNQYKKGQGPQTDRPGTLTPHAGSDAEKVPSEGGAP